MIVHQNYIYNKPNVHKHYSGLRSSHDQNKTFITISHATFAATSSWGSYIIPTWNPKCGSRHSLTSVGIGTRWL